MDDERLIPISMIANEMPPFALGILGMKRCGTSHKRTQRQHTENHLEEQWKQATCPHVLIRETAWRIAGSRQYDRLKITHTHTTRKTPSSKCLPTQKQNIVDHLHCLTYPPRMLKEMRCGVTHGQASEKAQDFGHFDGNAAFGTITRASAFLRFRIISKAQMEFAADGLHKIPRHCCI